MQFCRTVPAQDALAVEEQLPVSGGFQQVQAAEQGAFAAAGSAQNTGDVPGLDGEVDVPQDLMAAKGLAQVPDLQQGLVLQFCHG